MAFQQYGSVPNVEQEEGTRNQLGVVNGVFVPCLLNILGVILFLRLGWAVSHVGWLGMLGMFAVGETLAILTVLSLSAIVSNGNMRGGGSYYMISRCLGPEFGGSVGILFYFAYAVGTAFYVVGFATEIVTTFLQSDNQQMMITIVASITLPFVMIVSLIGAEFFTKINRLLFLGQFATILIGIAYMLFQNPDNVDLEQGNFTGPNLDTLQENKWPQLEVDPFCGNVQCTWSTVFGIIFPAMTGIMEGANLSGDLKNPGDAIGKGTLSAVFAAIVTYASLIFSMSAGFTRDALRHNESPMQLVVPSKYIIVLGIAISTSSSALGSIFGGSRVLQALARDDLPFPGLSFFAAGSLHGDEPRRAVILTWIIAQMFCLIGSLDAISSLSASFFCLSYASVNFCCFVLDLSGTPNFRPRFKYYNRMSTFLGFALNIAVLFFLNVWYAVTAIGCLLVLFIWIAYKGPVTSWGDVSQAIIFHQVRKYLLRLDERKTHVKYWRPSVLLILDDVDGPLIDFCNSLKKGGLYVLGSVLVGDVSKLSGSALSLRNAWLSFITKSKVKALPNVAVAPSAKIGYQNLLLCTGLGGMRPNTVVLPLFEPCTDVQAKSFEVLRQCFADSQEDLNFEATSCVQTNEEYVSILKDTLLLQINVLITCNFNHLDDSLLSSPARVVESFAAPISIVPTESTSTSDTLNQPLLENANEGNTTALQRPKSHISYIDVWILGNWDFCDLDGTLSLQLQMAHIIHLNSNWEKQTNIRFINVISPPVDSDEGSPTLFKSAQMSREKLSNLCRETRINAEIDVVFATGEALQKRCGQFGTSVAPTTRMTDRSFSLLDESRTEQQMKDAVSAVESEDSLDWAAFQREMKEFNEVILERSKHTKLVFLMLPHLPRTLTTKDSDRYVDGLYSLTQNLPPTVLLASGQNKNVIPQDL